MADGIHRGITTGMARHGAGAGVDSMVVTMVATMAVIMVDIMAAIGVIIIITDPITATSTDEHLPVIPAIPVRVIQIIIAGLPVRVHRHHRGGVHQLIAEVQQCEAVIPMYVAVVH
jgi:hypothetical protein